MNMLIFRFQREIKQLLLQNEAESFYRAFGLFRIQIYAKNGTPQNPPPNPHIQIFYRNQSGHTQRPPPHLHGGLGGRICK